MPPKRKVSELENGTPDKKQPIIFTARGLNIDARLRVFDTDFHVHSTILKLHSAFFFKFLDSPEKKCPAEIPPGSFRYEWVTSIDEDGTWGLVARESLNRSSTNKLNGVESEQTKAFHNLLNAFYGVAYQFDSIDDLVRSTDIADYYCALPALSRSILGAYNRRMPCIRTSAKDTIGSAYKLRHRELFKDCVLCLAGDWREDRQTPGGLEPKIEDIIKKARTNICEMIAEAQTELLQVMAQESNFADKVGAIEIQDYCGLPWYYRRVLDLAEEYADDPNNLAQLLKNNLTFEGRDIQPGTGEHSDYFLCADVEIPWDETQPDW